MRYRFFPCDVFTSQRFRGNQLAVLPEADGLTDEQMQQIAREFNFSETTFVFPPRSGHTRRVRIFTPATEVPFAGHPNIGTAFVLASTGALGPLDLPSTVTFEEKAGLVPITVEETEDGKIRCELSAPSPSRWETRCTRLWWLRRCPWRRTTFWWSSTLPRKPPWASPFS